MDIDKLRVIHKFVGVKFTEDMLKDFFNKRKNWKEMPRKVEKQSWQKIALSFDYKNDYGLSIVAGEHLYSIPRTIANEYFNIEIGLLHIGNLVDKRKVKILKADIFSNDSVEGYVDFEKFIKIVEFVESLPKSEQNTNDKQYSNKRHYAKLKCIWKK